MKIYRIKNIKDNTYFSGGGDFTPRGKIWFVKAHVINALNSLNRTNQKKSKRNLLKENINNWVIEEYELTNPKKTYDVLSFMSDGDPKKEYDILSK